MTNRSSPPGWLAGDPLFHEVWEHSLDAQVLSDSAGVVVLANPAYYKLYAYSPEAVLGHDFAIIFPEEEREAARAGYRAIYEAGLPVEHVESVVRRSDGSTRVVETRASFVLRHGERYLLSVIRDITERKAVEQQLHRAEQLLAASQRTPPPGGAGPAAEDRIAELNRSLEARIGERTAQLAETVQELLQEVSARAAVQAELQSVLRLQQAILASANYAIIATGLDGTILSFNPAAERMLGYRADEVIGRKLIADFHDSEELAARVAELSTLLGINLDLSYGILHPRVIGAQSYEAEWRYRRADGSTIPVSVSLTVLRDDDGVPEGYLAIVNDIGQRHAAEEALRQANADLARAARLKDEFLANMSHELRTPLNAILGRAEVLQDQIYGPLNERQQHSICTIEESGRDLLALINDILDIAKIEAGRIELQLESCDIPAICSASLRLVAEVAKKKRIAVNFEFDGAVTNLIADPRRLKQILVNLLSNAVKFTPVGGSIGFESHGDVAAGEVSFIIWDTGIGIAPEDQGRLFQPFVQIDSSLARQYSGTGLGLSLVDRLSRMHGGRVELVSAPGRGTRFTVTIPWHSGLHAAAAPEPEPEPLGATVADRRILVLLVDDSPANIDLVREYLEVVGYSVATACSGDEALRLIAAVSPAVVVMDIQMPGMDGLEAIRRLRAASATADLPIIALTALAMVGDRERCLAAGANEYLSKPFALKQLAALIARHAVAPTAEAAK